MHESKRLGSCERSAVKSDKTVVIKSMLPIYKEALLAKAAISSLKTYFKTVTFSKDYKGCRSEATDGVSPLIDPSSKLGLTG